MRIFTDDHGYILSKSACICENLRPKKIASPWVPLSTQRIFMSQLDHFIAKIQHVYPDVAIHSAYLDEGGQYNHVVVVNDAWIFRFARFAESAETLRREVMILSAIRPHISLTIPEPLYQNFDTIEADDAFIGYRMIPGTPLWPENYQKISNGNILRRMAEQLAGFLKELHTLPVSNGIASALVPEDQPVYWADLYQRFQRKLFPYMRLDAQQEVRRRFEHFLHNPTHYQFTPVLRHGDFGGGNVIADLDTGNITGIIDFGATTLGDPAIDFGGLAYFGDEFFQHAMRIYPEIEAARHRMEFYQSTFALQEALYGVEHNDPEAFRAGIAEYISH